MIRVEEPRSAAERVEGLVSCLVGEEQYTIRGTWIREIVRTERLRRATNEFDALGAVGTLVLDNGDTIPVFALAAALGRGSREPDWHSLGNHIVVTRGSAGPAGWLVDRIVRSHLSDPGAILPLPASVGWPATRWFEGVLSIADQASLLLSPERLDPRFTPRTAEDAAPAEAAGSIADTDAAGTPLVLMFSTPVLPDGDAVRYVVSARRVAAVVPSLAVTRVPGSAPHVVGVAVWRGRATPVVDFRAAAAQTGSADAMRYLVGRCAGADADTIAVAVRTDMTLREASSDDRPVADSGETWPPFVVGVYELAGERHALLDFDRLAAMGQGRL